MKQYKNFFFFFLITLPLTAVTQEDFNTAPLDDLGDVSDDFRFSFFEALQQKGIENYDKAIIALETCAALAPNNPSVYFELGKNYNKLKNFGAAEQALKKAHTKAPKNPWILNELYRVYVKQNNTSKAKTTLNHLVAINPKFKKEQVQLYVQTKDYKAALNVLDAIESERGTSSETKKIRNRIYAISGLKKARTKNLEEKIEANPNSEENYLALIYSYSQDDKLKKAYETALKLLKQKPESELVHLALYKFYLNDNKPNAAIASMKTVLKSTHIQGEAKNKVYSDFVKYVSENPKYETVLSEIRTQYKLKNNLTITENPNQEKATSQKQHALNDYLKALKKDSDNFSLIKRILELHVELKQYKQAAKKSATFLETYPSQPILYLVQGLSKNKLQQPNEAVTALETGVDYIIEDKAMEIAFYKQLANAYTLLSNLKKAEMYIKKVQKLEQSN